MKIKKVIIIVVILIIIGVVGYKVIYDWILNLDNKNSVYSYDGSLGSAGKMEGTTVVISIFANEEGTSWNYEDEEDNATIHETLQYLKIATNWLSEQVRKYDKEAMFVCDWGEYSDLKYEADFEEKLVGADIAMYEVQTKYIENNIDGEKLKKKCNAENIIYLFYFNTDFSNKINSWTLGYSNDESYYYEFCNIFVKYDGKYVMEPSGYAHEIMHTFGAHDLYYPNRFISMEYVQFCRESNSNDIMFTTCLGEDITNDFTDLDAYYVGICDGSSVVEEWDLAISEHEK